MPSSYQEIFRAQIYFLWLFFFFVPLPYVDKGLSTFYLERIGEILRTVLAGAP